MTLQSRELPALFNGVSQQPAASRQPSHVETLVNASATVVDGLTMRNPLEHVARISNVPFDGATIHTINRDVSQRFKVVMVPGDLRVFDTLGNEQAVVFPYGKTYLQTVSAANLTATTVADYTFIVNKGVRVVMSAAGADTLAYPADYAGLSRQTNAAGAPRAYPPNPAGGTYRGKVQSFQKLPTTPLAGDIYEIVGGDTVSFSPYYVRRNGAVWEEAVAPGIRNRIDALTMPWALVRGSNGIFTFAPFAWRHRPVGDETTNPNPAFVNRTIRDIYFTNNRLGFAVGEGVVMSRTGDFGTFYRLTTLDSLPDEVVDIAASETSVTDINFAVPFKGGMAMFSEQVQFKLTYGSSGLTPGSASLDVATRHVVNNDVRPFPMAEDLFFVTEAGQFSQVREYFLAGDSGSESTATEITSHVPRYIPRGVRLLTGSATQRQLFVVSAAEPTRVYTYRYFYSGQQKAQSCWSYWTLPSDGRVLSLAVLDDYLYVVTSNSDGTYLSRLALSAAAVVPDLGFQVHLDRRAAATGNYLAATNETEWFIPYSVAESQRQFFRIVRGGAAVTGRGSLVSADPAAYRWVSPTNVRVTGNFAGAALVGQVYEFRVRFSAQYATDRNGVPRLDGRLQLRTYSISYARSVYFRTEVSPYGPGSPPEGEEVVPGKLDTAGECLK